LKKLKSKLYYMDSVQMISKEQSIAENLEEKHNDAGPRMKLKIQRLEREDFFVTINKNDLIAKLKENILAYVKAHLGNEDFTPVLEQLRLIYKGKLLLDAKSIEFYKIQNYDTIQLCPLRRRARDQQQSHNAGESVDGNNNASREVSARTGGFALISFSLSELPEVREGGSSGQPSRNRRHGLEPDDVEESNSQSRNARARPRRMDIPEVRDRHSPRTFEGRLCNINSVLQETLRRVSETNRENRYELIPQLDELVRQASNLRENLVADRRSVPQTVGLFNIFMVERIGSSRMENSGNAGEEKEDDFRNSTSTQNTTESRTEAVVETSSNYAGQEISENSYETPVVGPIAGAAVTTTENQASVTENEPTQQRRSSRYLNAFSSFISRIGRR